VQFQLLPTGTAGFLRPRGARTWKPLSRARTWEDTIGLACAQAVAIRGAPDAARRHAAVPRALPLRVAHDDWDLNDFHERARA
jgi:hypothetical protein